jgi:hypothetical protein
MQKPLIALIVVLIIIAGGAYWYHQTYQNAPVAQNPTTDTTQQQASSTAPTSTIQAQTTIGKSVEGRDIVAYNFGDLSGSSSTKEILFVGGIHGGYEWNTALVAYQLVDYLKSTPGAVPAGERVTVIPAVNPDGLYKVTGKEGEFAATDVNPSQDVQVAGRFNANTVDLNRNFDCDWQASGVWQTKKVSGGTAAFSEPESQAIKAYVQANTPTVVIAWYSSAGGVYASNCHGGVLPETSTISGVYAQASGYPAHESFDFYATTGDMTNWLAKMNIPAFSVLLTNHTDTEWAKNQKGVQAVLEHYAQ